MGWSFEGSTCERCIEIEVALLTSGNFVSAKPVGIHEGIDHKLTGSVRRIDAGGIRRQLDAGSVVYLDHLAHSPAGELYNLASEEVAAETAVALHADKLVLMGETPYCLDQKGGRISELALSLISTIKSNQNDEMKRRLDATEKAAAVVSSVAICSAQALMAQF